MNDLILELKELIIESLDLEDMTPDDIDTEAMLFGDEGLGLDSIDALELGLAIHKKYDVKLNANSDVTKQHFRSVATLAAFITENQDK
jgi:acyl carrier protein